MIGLFVIYDVAFDEDIMEILKKINIRGFTKWEKVIGSGENSNPKMDNAVWPGFNCCIFLVIDQRKRTALLNSFKQIFGDKNIEGIKIFEIPVTEII